MEQEHTWAIWGKVELMSMLRKSYGTCMRCWNACLGGRELPAATGQYGLEDPEANLTNRCWRANTTRGKVILSRNRLFTNKKRFFVQFTWRSSRWTGIWGRIRNLWILANLILPISGAVFRKKLKKPYMLGLSLIHIWRCRRSYSV